MFGSDTYVCLRIISFVFGYKLIKNIFGRVVHRFVKTLFFLGSSWALFVSLKMLNNELTFSNRFFNDFTITMHFKITYGIVFFLNGTVVTYNKNFVFDLRNYDGFLGGLLKLFLRLKSFRGDRSFFWSWRGNTSTTGVSNVSSGWMHSIVRFINHSHTARA